MTTYLTAPDGSRWAVVPVEATPEMCEEGALAFKNVPAIYAAMLQAAPAFHTEQMVEKITRLLEDPTWGVWSIDRQARAILAALFEVKP